MRLPFTKMQGAGNDFVVLDGTRPPLAGQVLSRAQLQHLGDRRWGVGADQILRVEPSPGPGVDFAYRIFNGASGDEVEHCGNGARCLMRFLHEQGLSRARRVQVATVNRQLALMLDDDGRVRVDMGPPCFELARVPFDARGLSPRLEGGTETWPLHGQHWAVLSMGNPHAVARVAGGAAELEAAPLASLGPQLQADARFAQQVNVGLMSVLSRRDIALRVHERGAGETLACGTGACAAVVAGIRLGWLDPEVEVHTRGGRLRIAWAGGEADSVFLSGPAQTVFQGEIDL